MRSETITFTVAAVGVVGGVAAFIAYLVAAQFDAASWAGIAALFAAVLVWDLRKNHRRGVA